MVASRHFAVTAAMLALFLGFPSSTAAQWGQCSQVCDPYTTPCFTTCEGCLLDYPDGYCPQQDTYVTTCGNWAGGCIREDCTPSWSEQSSTQIGAHESCWWFECRYYWSLRVYECDANQCNQNPSYYCRYRCEDVQLGYHGGECGCCMWFYRLGGCWGLRC